MKTPIRKLATHKTHRESAIRFALLLAVLLGCFAYLSIKFDLASRRNLALFLLAYTYLLDSLGLDLNG